MSRTLFVLFLVVAVATAASMDHTCPENQEWTNCGTACPPSCNSPPNQPCTLQCMIGCQCKEGFLVNPAGECVLPQNC